VVVKNPEEIFENPPDIRTAMIMDDWTALGTVCCASSRSTSPVRQRIHRLSKTLPATASPYGSKYSALDGIAVEDSRRGIPTVLPEPINADCKPLGVFRSNLNEAAGMEKSEVHMKLVCSAV
jgi:hypothetical protein